MEISNEIIPQILRMDHPSGVLTHDPETYALVLRFYDGLCCWEEDSQTPVMHITWATHMLASISKFDVTARTSMELLGIAAEADRVTDDGKSPVDKTVSNGLRSRGVQKRHFDVLSEPTAESVKSDDMSSVHKTSSDADGSLQGLRIATVDYCDSIAGSEVSPFGIDSQLTPSSDELKMNLAVEQLTTQSDENSSDADRSSEISALAHACSESLLNPDFLRSGGEPFVKQKNSHHQLMSSALTNTQMDLNAFVAYTGVDPIISDVRTVTIGLENTISVDSEQKPTSKISANRQLVLRSAKMLALKQLLVAPKLNASAIKLHLTAQSQGARKPTHVGRPLATQFFSDDARRYRATTKRRRTNDD